MSMRDRRHVTASTSRRSECRRHIGVGSDHGSQSAQQGRRRTEVTDMFVFVIVNGSKRTNILGKVVIKILQGSAITQTVLGGLTIHLLVANFL